MRRIAIVTLAALAFAGLVLLGGAVADDAGDAGDRVTRPARPTAALLLAGFRAGDTEEYVRRLEARLAGGGADDETLTLLGLGYQQRARETGDPRFYRPAERALRRALRLEPRSPLTLAALAALAASRHRFVQARMYARRALDVDPHLAAAWGILGDAEVETGRYRAAFGAFNRMAALKPSAAAYARISYAREILGRTAPAIAAMRQAVEAAAGTSEPAAWALTNLGNLFAESGRLRAAARRYREALERVPRYAPALAGIARLELWRGDASSAARLYRDALARQALPEYAVGLGDASATLGDERAAETAYVRAAALEAAFAANGGRNQLETALFDLDHGRDLAGALVRAREGRGMRPSVEGEHVLAWALYKNGRCGEARRHSVRALRLGTKDWGAMLHRSLIESCLGNEEQARAFRDRALQVNPYALVAFGQATA